MKGEVRRRKTEPATLLIAVYGNDRT